MKLMRCAALLSILLLAPAAGYCDAPDPTTQPAAQDTDLLGPKFTSSIYGIEFSPPSNSTEIHRPTPDDIVEFVRDDYDWQFKAWRERLEKSLPLSIHKDQFDRPQDGVMEIVLNNIKQGTPDVQVLRNEIINVGRVRVGMLAVRYETADHQRRLTQRAIIEAPDADNRLYYILELTGPGKPPAEPEDIVNPAERAASETFGAVVDSVNLLDRRNIADDQKQRLYSAHALFVNWNGARGQMVRSALVPEQWQRILKDGKDVGYSYIVESLDDNNKAPEEAVIHIGVRSRLMPTPLLQWDTETSMTSTLDRKHESWWTNAQCINNKGAILDHFTQLATSDEQAKAVVLQPLQSQDGSLNPDAANPNGPNAGGSGPLGQGNVDIETVRTLEVNTSHGKVQLSPFKRDVPVFYVPQTFSYLLPTILPLNRPHGYMFATFVPSAPGNANGASVGDVMARYMDVLPVQDVKFNGGEYDAIPINDKLTLGGTITTYYMTAGGKFIGSLTHYTEDRKDITITVVPSDADTLQRLWNKPDLAPPNQAPAAATASDPAGDPPAQQ